MRAHSGDLLIEDRKSLNLIMSFRMRYSLCDFESINARVIIRFAFIEHCLDRSDQVSTPAFNHQFADAGETIVSKRGRAPNGELSLIVGRKLESLNYSNDLVDAEEACFRIQSR